MGEDSSKANRQQSTFRTLLIALPLVALAWAAYIFLQLEAIRVNKESAEHERAKAAASKTVPKEPPAETAISD